MKARRLLLRFALLCALALVGCDFTAGSAPERRQVRLDYSWVAAAPRAELAAHFDRANVFMAADYYRRQAGYASGEIPPPHLLYNAYSSHPLAYYALRKDAAEREAVTGREVAASKAESTSGNAGAQTESASAMAARHFARGLIFYDLGDFDSAIAELTRAIQFDARHARAYAFRALAHRYTGSPAKAHADLQSAIRLKAEPMLIAEVRRALKQ